MRVTGGLGSGSAGPWPAGDSPASGPAGGIRVEAEVKAVLNRAGPVVFLESNLLATGLPPEDGRRALAAMAEAVRSAGAVPAVVGVVRGEPRAGLGEAEIAEIIRSGQKLGPADLGPALAAGLTGGTTAGLTLLLAAHLTPWPILATGGIGGVGADDPADVSADLWALGRYPGLVVCSGPKLPADARATLEWLETRGVPVVGYRTGRLPRFFVADGPPLRHRVETAEAAVAAWVAHRRFGGAGLLLAVPPPSPAPPEIEGWTAAALEAARWAAKTGSDLTPLFLQNLARLSGGLTVGVNIGLLRENAAVAARCAQALSRG